MHIFDLHHKVQQTKPCSNQTSQLKVNLSENDSTNRNYRYDSHHS